MYFVYVTHSKHYRLLLSILYCHDKFKGTQILRCKDTRNKEKITQTKKKKKHMFLAAHLTMKNEL